jgi:hypothetical protein
MLQMDLSPLAAVLHCMQLCKDATPGCAWAGCDQLHLLPAKTPCP